MPISEKTTATLASVVLMLVSIVVVVLAFMVYYYADKYNKIAAANDIMTAGPGPTDFEAVYSNMTTAKYYMLGAFVGLLVMMLILAYLMYCNFGTAAAVGTIAVAVVVALMSLWYYALFSQVGTALTGGNPTPNPQAPGFLATTSRPFTSYIYSFVTAYILAAITAFVFAAWSAWNAQKSRSAESQKLASDYEVKGSGVPNRQGIWTKPIGQPRNWYSSA